MAKFLCPFCLHEYNKKEVLHWCSSCKKASEPRFGEKTPILCKQKGCGGKAFIRKCKIQSCPAGPNGTEFIPNHLLDSKHLRFSIIGVPNSGKTNFITVMLHELERGVELGLPASAVSNSSRQIQAKNYKLIYVEHKKPDATVPGKEPPQIWQLLNHADQHGSFTVFDGAGESTQRMDPTSLECRYIAASEAIIITIDPLILENVRNSGLVDKQTIRNSRQDDEGRYMSSTAVVNSMADYIRAACGISGKKALKLPVAVVLTKLDTILNHPDFSKNAIIRAKSTVLRNGRVDMTELDQLDGEIRNWLTKIGEVAFLKALEGNFKNYRLFGVSSYGSPPGAKNTPDQIRPHRILDPLIWLLSQQGFF